MMKKILNTMMLLIVSFLGIKNVDAACDYEEKATLNREVANVKANYEPIKELVDPSLYECVEPDANGNCEQYNDILKINILNLSDKFYVQVKEKVNNTNKKYYYSDANENGILSFDWKDVYQKNKFTITIYTSTETNCPNEQMKVIYLDTPRKNPMASFAVCKQAPDYYLCQDFVTYDEDLSVSDFIANVNEEAAKENVKKQEEKEKSFNQKLSEFISDNKIIIICCAIVIVLITVGTIVFVIKKRRSYDEI